MFLELRYSMSEKEQRKVEKKIREWAKKQAKEEVGAYEDNTDAVYDLGGEEILCFRKKNLVGLIAATLEFYHTPAEL